MQGAKRRGDFQRTFADLVDSVTSRAVIAHKSESALLGRRKRLTAPCRGARECQHRDKRNEVKNPDGLGYVPMHGFLSPICDLSRPTDVQIAERAFVSSSAEGNAMPDIGSTQTR